MSRTFTVGASLAFFFAIAVLTAPAVGRYLTQNVETATESKSSAVKDADRAEVQTRVSALAVDGCQARAIELVELHAAKPLMTRADIPPLLSDDLLLCVDRKIMRSYILDDLREKGLLLLLTGPL